MNSNKRIIQNRIEQLIFRADDFLKMSESLFYLYEKFYTIGKKNLKLLNSDTFRFLVLHQNLYFFEVLILFSTLFEEKKQPTELSYAKLFHELTKDSDYFKAIAKVKKQFRNSGFKEFRDQIIAHKDIKANGDPLTLGLNVISKENIKIARKIINDLLDLNQRFNPNPTGNNYADYFDSLQPIQVFLNRELETLLADNGANP